MTVWPIIALAAGTLAFWWLTRGLRKEWYPRFAIEIALIVLVAGITIVGVASSVYQQNNPSQGEAE